VDFKVRKKAMGQKSLKCCVLAIVGLVVSLSTVTPEVSAETLSESWQFEGKLYLWAPDIKGETVTGTDIEIDFDTIIENLDLVYMGNFGARKEKWSLLADVIYMDLDDDSDDTLFQGPLGNLTLTLTDVAMEAWIVTPIVAYNIVHTDRLDLNLLAGARYFWLETTVKTKTEHRILNETTLFSATESGDVWDGIVGARGSINLNGNWSLPFHFDVGTGDTDLTWQAVALVKYNLGQWDVGLGYRHLEWDFDDSNTGGDVFDDLYISGPVAGIEYSF
jgi:hypothetical protein